MLVCMLYGERSHFENLNLPFRKGYLKRLSTGTRFYFGCHCGYHRIHAIGIIIKNYK